MPNEQSISTGENSQNSQVEQQKIPANSESALKMSSIQDLLMRSWPVYKSNLNKFIGMMLIPLLAFIVLGSLVFLLGLFVLFLKNGDNQLMPVIKLALILIILAALFLFFYIAIITQAGMYILIKDNQENITIKEAFLRGKKVAVKFFILNLLIGIFVFLWSLLLVIPGIYMAIAYSAAAWIFIYEGIAGTAAIKKSKELVKGYWLPVFGRYAALYILLYLAIFLPMMLIEKNSGMEILWSVITQIISFLSAPFIMVYVCFIYQDLKRVKKINE